MKARRKATAPVRQVPWTEELGVFFRLRGENCTPPRQLAVIATRTGFTISGPFTLEGGLRVRLTTRVTVRPDGEVYVTSEQLKLTSRLVLERAS